MHESLNFFPISVLSVQFLIELNYWNNFTLNIQNFYFCVIKLCFLGRLDRSKKASEFILKIDQLRSNNDMVELLRKTRFVISSDCVKYLKKSAKNDKAIIAEIENVCKFYL